MGTGTGGRQSPSFGSEGDSMDSLGTLLVEQADELTTRWHQAVSTGALGSHGLSVEQLKDSLAKQLRLVGEAITSGGVKRGAPWELWRDPSRLAPEDRVLQQVPIEELIAEYAHAVEVVRRYLAERSLQVAFEDYAFFSSAMFYLAAESARRYSEFAQEQVTRDRRLYLAGIAHQMRTPLSALASQVQALRRTGAAGRRLELIGRSVRRLVFLVEGVLRLERFKPSEIPVRPAQIPLRRFLEDLGSDHLADAERKGLRLELHADSELRADLDPDLLTDAVGNLLSNAVKNTDQGFVRIEAGHIGDRLRIRVSDSGKGIPKAQLEKLFNVGASATRGSTGIGLVIAQRAAQAMGGSIEVQSQEGRGSVFSVTLPVRVPEREQQDAQRPAHAP